MITVEKLTKMEKDMEELKYVSNALYQAEHLKFINIKINSIDFRFNNNTAMYKQAVIELEEHRTKLKNEITKLMGEI